MTKVRIKPRILDVVEDDGMWLDKSTMTYYSKEDVEEVYLSRGLEEAADRYALSVEGDYAWSDGPDHFNFGDLTDAFVAGAKWQEEQDKKEQADLLTIVALDTAQRVKEQLMKDAVDGTVHHCATVHYVSTDDGQLPEKLKQFQDGDKVKVIVIKED